MRRFQLAFKSTKTTSKRNMQRKIVQSQKFDEDEELSRKAHLHAMSDPEGKYQTTTMFDVISLLQENNTSPLDPPTDPLTQASIDHARSKHRS